MSSTTKHKTDVVPKTKTFNSVKSGSVDADEMLCLRKSSMAGDAMGIISKKLHDKRKGGRSIVDDEIEEMDSFEEEGFDFSASEGIFEINSARDFDGFAHNLDQNFYETGDLSDNLYSHGN